MRSPEESIDFIAGSVSMEVSDKSIRNVVEENVGEVLGCPLKNVL